VSYPALFSLLFIINTLFGISIFSLIFELRAFKKDLALKISSLEAQDSNRARDVDLRLKDFRDSLSKVVAENAEFRKSLRDLPSTVLRTIQGSVNNTTGKLGELVKFIELQRSYDRLVPLGSIVDFMGVRLPEGDDPGGLDFIDVKTGKRAVLSKDQKALRDVIKAGHINFKTVKVEIT